MEGETEQQQTANFYRLIRLLIDIGGEALRDVLMKEIPSYQLGTVICYNRPLLTTLKRQKVFTDPQWNLLQERPPDPSKFDISMLVALLRNICPGIEPPTPDWSVKVPDPTDLSTGAELLRIKNMRNITMHVSSTLLPKATFEPLWIELSDTIQRIASKVGSDVKIARKIGQLEGVVIDPSGEREKEVLKALKDWKTQIVDILNEKLISVQKSLESLHLKNDRVLDVVDAVRSHGDTMNETLVSLHDQLTQIAEDISSISQGVSSMSYQAQEGGDNIAVTSSDIREIKEHLQLLQRELASIKQKLWAQRTQTGQQPIFFDVEDMPNMAGEDIPDVGDLSNRDIDKIAQNMGFEWERIATFLDYEHGQIDALKSIYRDQPVERNNRMLQKWRDVVVGRGENPRILLAAAFASIEHNEMAQYLVPVEQVEEIKDLEAKKETKIKIKGIKFDCQGTDNSQRKNKVTVFGGKDAFSVMDGKVDVGSLCIYPSVDTSIQTFPDPSSLPKSDGNIWIGGQGGFSLFGGTVTADHIQIGHPTPLYNRKTNICRGEGIDMPDARGKSSGSNFKKPSDNTLLDITLRQYEKTCQSVGVFLAYDHIIGTVFRVGSKYVMTAFHCLQGIIDPMKNGAINWKALADPQVLVSFNYPSTSQNQTSFNIQEVAYFKDEFDFVILELTDPDKLPPALNLYPHPILPQQMLDVDIIGHGHPDTLRKAFDPACQVVFPGDDVIQSAHAWLHQNKASLEKCLKSNVNPASVYWGYAGYDKEEKIIFNCYLEHGASGAPMLFRNGPRVVGLVTSGLPQCFWDLTSTGQKMFPVEYRFEMGTRMMHIYQDVMSKNSVLARDLFGQESVV